jgi:hypothetical protein
MAEGVMFDWSGVYFKDVIHAPGPLVILGYFFYDNDGWRSIFGDGLIHKFGRKNNANQRHLISAGLFTQLCSHYIPSIVCWFRCFHDCSNTLYCRKKPNVPPGEALTIVSSVSFLGFLMGPPVIGYVAELSSLRFSFAFIGVFGILIAVMVSRIKAIQ